MDEGATGASAAVSDFYRARRRAGLRRLLAQLGGGREQRAISYEEVRKRLRAVESARQELQDVPVDAIVGSVGRYNDFTREFLPRYDAAVERWVGVKMAMTGMEGVPPIQVYRVGDAYFVRDGNHRVSVARQLGVAYLQAYVTPVHTRVPYSPEDDPESLIVKAEYADFLERTRVDELRPGADLRVTEPGAAERLLEHVSVHRYFMGIDEDREVGYEEAVAHFYDTVYLPVVKAIRTSGILGDFPGRTEADLYLWMADHRAKLEEELGWELPGPQVVQGVAGGQLAGEEERGALLRRLAAKGDPGEVAQLADDLLVAFDLGDPGMTALEQALVFAQRERARVYGVRVMPEDAPEEERRRTEEIFDERCRAAGVRGQLAVVAGDPVTRILERARWADVVIANLAYRGRGEVEASLARNVRPLLRHSPRPLLALSGVVTPLERPLVAYDGGPRAEAALFAAVYAALKWGQHPVVLTVEEWDRSAQATLDRARAAFERYGASADYLLRDGPVAERIAQVARDLDRDVILLGSYKHSRFLEDVFGGVPEELLRRAPAPLLLT